MQTTPLMHEIENNHACVDSVYKNFLTYKEADEDAEERCAQLYAAHACKEQSPLEYLVVFLPGLKRFAVVIIASRWFRTNNTYGYDMRCESVGHYAI